MQVDQVAQPIVGRIEFETLIADLSSRFINLPPADVDLEIQEALHRACEVLGVDLAALWQWSMTDPGHIAPTHVAYARKDKRAETEERSEAQLPWYRGEMRAGRMVVIATLEELPEEAAVDLETCRRLGIKSNLSLPLAVGGESPVGVLSFSTLIEERSWSDALVQRLRIIAQVFTNALVRRRHELFLKESADRLSLAADAADAGLWTLDRRTGAFWLTERARTILAFPPDAPASLAHLVASTYPEDLLLLHGALDLSARETAPFNVEFRIALPGERRARWLALRGRPHFQAPGESEQLMGAVIDITSRKRVEAALRKSEARLAAGADLAGLAFYELNFAGRRAFLDDRCRELCGIPGGDDESLAAVEYWTEHLHPDDRTSVLGLREKMAAGEMDRLGTEYRYLHPTRGEIWLHHVALVTRRDPQGRPLSTHGVIRDTTERRRREEALRESNDEVLRLKDRLQAESDYLKAEIGAIRPNAIVTGDSPAIVRILRLVEKVAPTDSSVLIHGETGTGKELVAQSVHRQSSRKNQVMVSLNCAALPSGLVESELFGREKGAFTGALTRQIGRFELADHSTLFLDEIGELSLEIQAKLLRVLETGEFERLGNPRTAKADVRVVVATNRDLAEEVRKGRFREDLYYRLNVFPIRVPPLRERVDDIPLLVWTFLEEFSTRMGKKITQVSRKTMDTLQRYRWPGNVRELRNVIEHAAILATDDTLRVDALDGSANLGAPAPKLIDSERELIRRALASAEGRIKGPAGAARALGINPSTLYSRMKKLGITTRHSEKNST